ncbi:Mannosyltransferase [Pseudomonas syringae pv. actinidiae]|uniref:Mannosyltransferase n=1 Tax=Pseudomonas syringae pv. actinidiae TaxID=103796 RepID=A0AAN4TJG7_PSESF|nr:Mannosyltransferase [Pseudomonas syringae pv. actinidiae]
MGRRLLLILAEGRGSELVRERAGTFFEDVSFEQPPSRTSPLQQKMRSTLRPRERVCND